MATNKKSSTGSDCITKTANQTTCPDCGALECLCRPRFFAGQLLTEQDLNLLDQYIKKKDRLHNRNLHGWGVVNGLIVLCDPCDQIKVTKGYAVSPCGDDIVVCRDTAVDICALIRKCKQKARGSLDCRPFQNPPASECEEREEEWVLTIRYSEQPSRGMTALRHADCTCGGRNLSGCGEAERKSAFKPRGAPAECEPTIVCEGYDFDVFRKPEPQDPKGDDKEVNALFKGELVDRFMCCFNGLIATVPDPPQGTTQNNPTGWALYCCQLKENLIDFFYAHPTVDCQLIDILNRLTCPAADDDDFVTRFDEVNAVLDLIFIETMFGCLCQALLPPAPEATDDPRVPLAVVTVRARDCKILRICNWTVLRKMLITWPTLGYWSSLLPIGQLMHAAMEQICCKLWSLPIFRRVLMGHFSKSIKADKAAKKRKAGDSLYAEVHNAAKMRINPSLFAADQAGALAKLASLSAARGGSVLDPWAFLNSISRTRLSTKSKGLESIEKQNVAHFLLLNQIARPMGEAILKPEHIANFIRPFKAKAGPAEDKVADMSDRVAELEKKLKAQDETLKNQDKAIKTLKAKINQ